MNDAAQVNGFQPHGAEARAREEKAERNGKKSGYVTSYPLFYLSSSLFFGLCL